MREKPFSARKEMSWFEFTRLPGAAERLCPSISVRGTTRCKMAGTVVSSMIGFVTGSSNRANVASRRATMSATGETRS